MLRGPTFSGGASLRILFGMSAAERVRACSRKIRPSKPGFTNVRNRTDDRKPPSADCRPTGDLTTRRPTQGYGRAWKMAFSLPSLSSNSIGPSIS